jgi:hypothetical protein
LKARQKWKRDRPASEASAAGETSASLSERKRSMARRRALGDSPPMTGWNVVGAPACAARRRVARKSASGGLNRAPQGLAPERLTWLQSDCC